MLGLPTRNIDASEDVPLLDTEDADFPIPHRPAGISSRQRSKRIVHIFMLVVLLNSLGHQLMQSPQTRILEAVICYRHYERTDPSKIQLDRNNVAPGAIGGVEERWCKVGEVQSDLVTLRGWQIFLDCVPSLLLALPAGWAADRYGRKPFLLAGLGATALKASWIQLVTWFWQAFDVRMTLISTLFGSLGGGGVVTIALAFTVLSDVTPEAERSGVFLRVGAFSITAGLVMPPLAAWLMRYNPWIPVMMGSCLLSLSVLLFMFTPETLHFGKVEILSPETEGSSIYESFPPPSPEVLLDHERMSTSMTARWLSSWRRSSAFLVKDWRVPVLILPFLGYMFLGVCGSLVIQYISARYDLTLSDATLVAVVYSAVVVVVLFLVMPFISNIMVHRLHLSTMKKDLYLMRASQAILSFGWLLFGFSPNVPCAAISLAIAALGQGAPLLLRSFITSLLPQDQIATAYSVISIVDTLSTMLGAPLLAGLLKHGFSLGGGYVGLPFIFTSLLLGVFAIVFFTVGLRKGEHRDSVDIVDD